MPVWLSKVQSDIDRRNIRERVLLLCSALAVVGALWLFLVYDPLNDRRGALQAQLSSLDSRHSAQAEQLAELSAAGDPDADLRRQIDALERQISELDEGLSSLAQGLIGAERLPWMLSEVLEQTAQLTLLDVKTLPVRELPLAGARSGEQTTGVYRHTVSLRVTGNYFQVLDFVRSLESLQWRFYWDRLDYRVTRYPDAEVEIRVYTLSAEEGLLGV